jgi:tripartite-type tricarboxylate transporter receptor subunit TctC
VVCFALASIAPIVAAQASYPSRPIKLVVPYPPGALTDLLARAIGERLGAGNPAANSRCMRR